MNLYAPVSQIMSTDLITVSPREKMTIVEQIFKRRDKRIHHIPVVETDGKLVGMISKSDYLKMNHFFSLNNSGEEFEEMLESTSVQQVMTKGLAKLEPTDRIDVAARIFKENLFHAVPIVNKEGKLVGIVTTYDIINYCFEETWSPKS